MPGNPRRRHCGARGDCGPCRAGGGLSHVLRTRQVLAGKAIFRCVCDEVLGVCRIVLAILDPFRSEVVDPVLLPALSIYLFASAVLCAALVLHALRQPPTAFARHFAGLMLCSCLYALGYGLELGAADLVQARSALSLQYLALPFVPLCWVGLC
ncbi:MAG: hypothetical protein CGU28_16060 [Candidatus Dactylopiibacterium carminicum]|nr:MAG: hypothetical protein CGU28_16060 [Candidatus Dactylopiibacterium carminicum]